MIFLTALPLIVTSVCLVFSVQKNMFLMEKLEKIGESIEEAIDILEEQHRVIEAKTKIEVFSDEPIVRDLVEDMAIAKNSVIRAAKILDDSLNTESET